MGEHSLIPNYFLFGYLSSSESALRLASPGALSTSSPSSGYHGYHDHALMEFLGHFFEHMNYALGPLRIWASVVSNGGYQGCVALWR